MWLHLNLNYPNLAYINTIDFFDGIGGIKHPGQHLLNASFSITKSL